MPLRSRILIVHDQPGRREQLRDCLEPAHQVDVCGTVQEAIAILKSKEAADLSGPAIDLILSATHLDASDNLSVFDLLKWTRGNRQISNVPFILLELEPSATAISVIDATRAAGNALGATAYILTEDFHPDHFRALIDRYLTSNANETAECTHPYPSELDAEQLMENSFDENGR